MAGYAYTQEKPSTDSLQQVLQTSISDKERVDIYNKIANEYKTSDSTQTTLYASKAIRLAKKIDYKAGIANAYYHIGWIALAKDNYPKAIDLFNKTAKIAKAGAYLKGEANAYNGLGLCHKSKGDFHKALNFFFRALKIDEQLHNEIGVGIRYNNIGVILKRQNAFEQALKYYKSVLRIANAQHNKKLLALGYSNVGDIYRKKGYYHKALTFLRKALEFAENSHDKLLIAFDYQKLGETHLAQKNYAKALKHLHKALDIRGKVEANAGYSETLITIGKTYYQQKACRIALKYLDKGVGIAHKIGNPKIKRDGAKILADVYYELGNYKAAFKQRVLFKQISDRLKDEQILKDLAVKEAQLRFQHEKTAMKLAQDKKRLALEVQIKSQQSMLNLEGLVVVLLIAIFLLVSFLHKQKSNKKLTKANELTLQANEEILSINESLRNTLEVVEKQRDEIKTQQKGLSTQHLQLEQAYQSIKILNVVGQEITATLDLDKVLATIYEHVKQFMDVTNFGIGLYETGGQAIDYRLVVKQNKQGQSYPLDMFDKNQLAVWCIDHQKPIRMGNVKNEVRHYIKDFDQEAYLQVTSLEQLPASAMYMPLLIKNKVIGLIVVHSYQPHAYSVHHFNLLKNLSIYVAIALENALMHQQMDQKNRTLKKLGNFKQQMVNMVAHDLKNPLNNIIGLSEGFKEGSTQHNIHQSGLQMLHLIINMLDTQKLEEAELHPNQTSQNASTLINDAIEQTAWLAASKNIEVMQKIKNINILADEELIKRVLVNLFNNAIKYSPHNSDVLIQAERINHQFVKFSITDTGVGIPEDAAGKVFDKFYQVQAKEQNKQPYSTGIGLTFCKLAIEAHGGEIGVNSSINLGSTFWFTLPLATLSKSSVKPIAPPIINTQVRKQKSMGVLLNPEDKQYLKPWLAMLIQYEVYQLSKVKAVLQEMVFRENSSLHNWKTELEQALYNSNEEQYQQLISKYL